MEILMPHVIPYLSFNGNCTEAMRFYEQVLRAKLTILMSGADSPMAAQIPPESAHRILHARLELPDNGVLFAGDCPQHLPYEGIKGLSLTLNYEEVSEAQRVFNALADGGSITMPMQASFWAKSWGMLVDRFGAPWIINGGMLPI
jgi:PhnB protein